jgi:hypothetical protein
MMMQNAVRSVWDPRSSPPSSQLWSGARACCDHAGAVGGEAASHGAGFEDAQWAGGVDDRPVAETGAAE